MPCFQKKSINSQLKELLHVLRFGGSGERERGMRGGENESKGWGRYSHVTVTFKRKTLHFLGRLSLTSLTSTPIGRGYCGFQEEDSTLGGSSV